MSDAMCCALVDFGDERKPCKYNKWVMGCGALGAVIGKC
jgi:hypothetical protein